MTMKFIHYVLDDIPSILNVNQVSKFYYKRFEFGNPGDHRILYNYTGWNEVTLYRSNTKAESEYILSQIIKFINNDLQRVMVIKDDGEVEIKQEESRRLEAL